MIQNYPCPKCHKNIEEAMISADRTLWCPHEQKWVEIQKIVKDETVTTSYGYFECPKCGSKFYSGGPALHNGLGCADVGYTDCIYHVGPNCKEYEIAEES